jgi:hypothetical protein
MRVVITCALLLALSGCSALQSSQESKPVGVGGGADMLKKGPCACFPVKMQWNVG